MQENNTLSREKCQLLLDHCFSEVDLSTQQGKYYCEHGYKTYMEDRASAIESYKSTPGKGPMANHALEEYLHSETRLKVENSIKQPQQVRTR